MYAHVKAHQDKVWPWVICNGLANGAVKGYHKRQSTRVWATTLLPLEKAAVFIGNEKSTTDVGPNVCFLVGTKEAKRFYASPVVLVGEINKGVLSWLEERFKQVNWPELDGAVRSKPDMYQLWLSKQCIGICAIRHNLARIQDILDNKCLNCGQAWETSTHLNQCPDHSHSLLFKERVKKLSAWLHKYDRTDPELSYWIEKYLLFLGTRSFASLVKEGKFGSQTSLDLIGWTKFLHGKVSVEIGSIQQLYCMSPPSCQLTGKDWMKAFISHLLQISHSQWIFRDYTLHDKQMGYLRLRLCSEVLREIHELMETTPSDVPPESQYLLELNHSSLYNASYEDQAYWVLALKAARRAG